MNELTRAAALCFSLVAGATGLATSDTADAAGLFAKGKPAEPRVFGFPPQQPRTPDRPRSHYLPKGCTEDWSFLDGWEMKCPKKEPDSSKPETPAKSYIPRDF